MAGLSAAEVNCQGHFTQTHLKGLFNVCMCKKFKDFFLYIEANLYRWADRL